MKVVIVGGVAGGMSAATRLRRLQEDAEITVLERSGHVSFANCGLPYHVGGVIEARHALLLQTPRSLRERFNLDVRVRHEVRSIDRKARTVTATDLNTGESHTFAYDALVLSPGARPVRPPLPGIERALALRDIEDTDVMVAAVSRSPQTAVVIGGGYIGLEVAENLHHRGIDVTVVEALDQIMAPLDPEMAAPVAQHLRDHGIAVHLGSQVTEVLPHDVVLADGTRLPADLVVAAIGVAPDSSLAADCGLETGPRGAIVVDDAYRTSDPAIYAVGDATVTRDLLDGSQVVVPLAGPANRAGRSVADVISGRRPSPLRVAGTAIIALLGRTVASTGWNEKRLRAAGRPYLAIHTHPASHAGYYPGAEGMALKLLVDPRDGAILGAQGVGGGGVDKRVDVIATAMRAGLTAPQLAELELAYAPPYSSAKDPVNMLGYVAENRLSGDEDSVQWYDVARLQEEGTVVLDVRTPAEHAAGAIPGSVNIPVDELRDRLADLPPGDVVVHCAVGARAHTAVAILNQHGRKAANLDGGYQTWAHGTRS